jgi:hypothetical protein
MAEKESDKPGRYTVPVEVIIEVDSNLWKFKLKDSPDGRRLLDASPEEQREFVLASIKKLNETIGAEFLLPHLRIAAATLLRRRLPFTHDDLLVLLDWSANQFNNYHRAVPQMIKAVEDYLKTNPPTPLLKTQIRRLRKSIEVEYQTAETRRWVLRLKELIGARKERLPLVAGDAWSDAAIADLEVLDADRQAAWAALLEACRGATGSSPSPKWLKQAAPLLEAVGFAAFKEAALRWFPLVARPRPKVVETWPEWQADPNYELAAPNVDILRALVWLAAGREDRELARALAALAAACYRSLPRFGPRSVRVGNACVWALGRMPGADAVGQLAILKVKIKFRSAQKMIDAALRAAAGRVGLPPEEVEEMSVPSYGLQAVGVARQQLGDFTAELVVTGTSAAELRWLKADGKRQASAPQAVKAGHADEVKELTEAVKDIRKMLPAQRDRIENLYLERRSWPLAVWRERYLDHPLVGTLARRLVWRFSDDGRAAAGLWYDGRFIGSGGDALDRPNESTRVELWHPLMSETAEVLAWRELLAFYEIRQPFKQAHREIYLLTDAERSTRVYSNRFAAHVIKQHQFNALCGARGWKNALRLMVDDSYAPPTRLIAPWKLRAEYWVEGVGDNYGTDTTGAGTYLHLATDQVRFYAIDATENYAHAGGGGYAAGRWGQEGAPAEPLPLDQIPPLVFSEIMRDVDLFVGVASVGNDPTWADGAHEGRNVGYWQNYSFGDLSETAKTRRQVLERLIPRLKIAGRCEVRERFLVVRGDVRTYKIHLGSGNILMEPDDQYLCIVQSRGAGATLDGKVFLPFEGDGTLALILSKAFLLAADREIKDPTIISQITR